MSSSTVRKRCKPPIETLRYVGDNLGELIKFLTVDGEKGVDYLTVYWPYLDEEDEPYQVKFRSKSIYYPVVISQWVLKEKDLLGNVTYQVLNAHDFNSLYEET